MSIVEFRGGRITHRYLMRRSKEELARMVLDHIRQLDDAHASVKLHGGHLSSCPATMGECDCGFREAYNRAVGWFAP
jgi:hypothetical protein